MRITRRLVLAAAGLAAPAQAVTLPPAGLVQGGLLRGRVAPGTTVTLEGRAVRVAADGAFACGFGRDHGAEAVLALRHPDGRAERRALAIARRDWAVQRIDGLPPAAVTPDAAALTRIEAERARLVQARAADTAATGWLAAAAWPATGRISGVFGSQRVLNGQPRQPHYGLDVAAPVGAPVVAALPGRVTLAADFFFFGRLVVLDHGHGVGTLYAHLSEVAVTEGAVVAGGARIGAIGATGRVTGPHLHFSLFWFTEWLDPRPLLPEAM